MKYSGTTAKVFLLFLWVIITNGVQAQSTTSSPFSAQGLGDPEIASLSTGLAMGGISTSLALPLYLNPSNPAALGVLSIPCFDAGIGGYYQKFSDGTYIQSAGEAFLKNASFGFPLNRRWSAGFGLLPFTRMGYDIKTTDSVSGFGQLNYRYLGDGGLNKAYLNIAFSPVRDSTHQLILGITGAYLFGHFEKTTEILPVNVANAFNTRAITHIDAGDLHFEAGLLYRYKTGRNRYMIALSYGTGNTINATSDNIAYTFTGINLSEEIKDTVYIGKDTGEVTLPMRLGAGLGITIGTRWNINGDVHYQDWSQYSSFGSQSNLSKSWRLAMGVQHIPDYKAPAGHYFKRVRYRGGFNYEQGRIVVNNQPLSSFGMNLGLGFPLPASGSLSTINCSMEIGQRGNTDQLIVREQFVNFSIGISFAPYKFDKWFYKKKID